MRHTFRGILLPILVTAFVFSSCAPPPRILSQWTHPDYIPPKREVPALADKRVMVVGVSKQDSIRRNFEDAFASRLGTVGVQAVPSYRYIKEAGPVAEERLNEAVKRAGADAVVMTRLVAIEQRRQVSPGFYRPGFHRWYSWGWHGYYEPPQVYYYDVLLSETSVYDLATNEVVWTGTVRMTDPREVDRAISNYVETIVSALADQNLIRVGAVPQQPAS